MVDQNQAESSSVSKLKLKLKIPKTMSINYQEEEELPIQQIDDSSKNHVCKQCNRSFSSGKALGGHMSSAHVQAQANKILSLKKQQLKSKKTYTGFGCKICKRDFHSRKSLFGHMKSHPDRHYRGMDPPKGKHSFDYEEEEEEDDDFSYSSDEDADEFEENDVDLGPFTDLSASLTGWGVKGKRGRLEVESEPDEDQDKLHALALQLIRMVNSPPVPKKAEVVADNRAFGPGPDKMVVCKKNVEDMEKSTSILAGDHQDGFEIVSKAKRAKVDRCVNGSDEKIRSSPIIREKELDSSVCPTPTSIPGKLFTCTSCGKGFSTFQGLGGHMSSHTKPRVSISNTIDGVAKNKFKSSSKVKTTRGYAKSVLNRQVYGAHKKVQGLNLVDHMVTCNDQGNAVDMVPYNGEATLGNECVQGRSVDMVPYGSQATFENGSTQGSTGDRVSSSEQATSADRRTDEAPKRPVLLDLNEFPDEDEI